MKDRYDDFNELDPYEDDLDTFLDEYMEDPEPEEHLCKALEEDRQAQKAGFKGFRPLKADEIEVRLMGFRKVGNTIEGRLYLYMKARVPAQLLDETFGPLNWQVSYGDSINRCSISVFNKDLGCWISKENVGAASDLESEKDKSTASDAFKRAASYWGIGRELYTADDIITNKLKIVNNNKEGYNNPAFYRCYDKFEVSHIEYKDRKIEHIEIRNMTQNCIAYTK